MALIPRLIAGTTPVIRCNRRAAPQSIVNGRVCASLAALLLCTAAAGSDSPIPAVPVDGAINAVQLETAIRAVEAREGLDEETRTTVVDQLRDAQAQLQNELSAESAAAAFAAALDTAPAETARLRARLDEPAPPTPTAGDLGIHDDMPLAEVEQVLATALAGLAAADARVSEIESQLAAQAERPSLARQRINELRGLLDELSALIDVEPPPGEPPILTDARRLNAALKRDARTAELERLEKELLSNAVRLGLLRAQRDVAAREAAETRRGVEVLQAVVNSKRLSAVEQAQLEATEAEIAAAGKHPALRAIAEGNAELSEELPAVAADIERTTRQLREVEQQTQQLGQSLAGARQRLEVGGVTEAIGRMLLAERRKLPQVSRYRDDLREHRRTLSRIGLAQVRIEEQRRELTPMDAALDTTMVGVAADVADAVELDSIRAEALELLRDRRRLLDQAVDIYSTYLRALGDLDVAEQRLLDVVTDYRHFLGRHLLWIPSTTVIGVNTITGAGEAAAWAFSPRAWAGATADLAATLRENGFATLVATLLLGALLLSRRHLAVRYKAVNTRVGRLSTDHIGLTLMALVMAAIRALPLPFALGFIGWALERGPDPSEFPGALSLAFKAVAPFLYNLILFRILCAHNGIARVHFGWQEHKLEVIRRQLDHLILIGAPLVFVTALVYVQPLPAYRDSLARITFVVFMIVFAMAVRPIGNPRNGVVASYYEKRPRSWLSRLRWLWFTILVGGPLLLALLAVIGYLYTAAILTGHFIDTIWLLLGIVVANLVVLRWLALERRKIAWQMALEQREARKAEQESETQNEAEGEIPVIEPKPLDLDEVDQQTRRLLQGVLTFVGLVAAWGIWSEVLPALSIFDQISVWSRTVSVDGADVITPVTLADLLLAAVIAILTFVASRNLPGLMEIAVLRHLDLQPGGRYTINTLLRYAVVMIGLIAVLNTIGWNWSRIQWLVAALSVGLGFGLQEIVANFVSGLIILFERPVRVGDTVTVGQLSGTVTRVRIRATTITDWDRKEIIVPNKAFITEQVINWTLSDPITRVVVPVGIAYGSDVHLAHRVMEDTLRAQPLVLDEPPPKAYFMGFGDSSLDFKLYMYSRQLGDRFPIMHAVHQDILTALRDNGIEIPFPQRDLHLRSVADDVKGLGES